MARASILTKLPLDRFAYHMGINPLHFNQTYYEAESGICGEPIKQYSWQATDAIGREDIAMAIAQAESDIEQWVGYYLKPTYTLSELVAVTRPADPYAYNLNGLNPRGQRKSTRLRYGYVLYGGRASKTLVDDAVVITYSDQDGDGYKERARVTVTVPTGTTACELHVYYPSYSGADIWEIRPIVASVSGTTATIDFRREQCLSASLMEILAPVGADGAVDGNFLTTVDIYRVVNDPSGQLQLEWERIPNSCGCEGEGCDECIISTQVGCLVTRNQRLGIVHYAPASWDSTALAFDTASFSVARDPDRLRAWYLSGWQDPSSSCPINTMDPYWERTVSILAASYLDRHMCGCESLQAYLQQWREDLAHVTEGSSFQLSDRKVRDNPLGTTGGARFAWTRITQPGRQIGGSNL